MLKMIYCIRRKEGTSSEEFRRYWEETHGPLVRKNAPAMRIRRYVQSPTLSTPLNDAIRDAKGHQEPYDGVAELWWESMDELVAALGDPEFTRAQGELFEDESRFIDFKNSCSYFCEERVIVGN
jgi:uncharacterized protein (TIGR02118 family)